MTEALKRLRMRQGMMPSWRMREKGRELVERFSSADSWKAIVLYGLNQATYKIALGKTLLSLSYAGHSRVPWDLLSAEFLDLYLKRLSLAQPMPQQSIPARQTRMERIVTMHRSGLLSYDQAVAEVGSTAFGDVIHRFHNLADYDSLQGLFYQASFGRELQLTDQLHQIAEEAHSELEAELDARWSLLEGAFSIRQSNYRLANDLRLVYLEKGYDRTPLTQNIPFLQGYQGNICFYCAERMDPSDVHVDHLLPRQVMQHDEVWNLVLSHSLCNTQKADKVVSEHYMRKLILRNENIVGSNHPWKKRIQRSLGASSSNRTSAVYAHYNRVRTILGPYYWGGSPTYSPESDPFYRRLITVLNNRG